MAFFLVVPIVQRNLVVIIISVVRFVIQAAAGNVNLYLAELRHAIVGKQGWRMNA